VDASIVAKNTMLLEQRNKATLRREDAGNAWDGITGFC
jgi:hypothetical protein